MTMGRVYATCECGKKVYPSRKEARHDARTFYRGERMETYYCDRGWGGWHFGHAQGHEREAAAVREERSAG